MRRLLICLFCSALLVAEAHAQRLVTDSAGRVVNLPGTIERIFAAGPPASIFLYVLAPQTLLGWPRAPSPEEAAFLAPAVRDLPALGRLTGRGNTANIEVVLQAHPDLILDFGSTTATYVSLANRVQEQTGLPYLLIDGRLDNTAGSLLLLGGMLGVEERAETLAGYADQVFTELDGVLAKIPPEQRPRVYFARGPEGLETGLRGSINTEIIERVGAVNVADAPGQHGLANVTLEQVLKWNPEVIITLDDRFYTRVQGDPLWQTLPAVQAGRVYLAPTLPFGWVDRPPSVNRLIGIQWLSRLFYPEHFADDLRTVTRNFYRLFYHLDPSAEQLDELLAHAGRRSP